MTFFVVVVADLDESRLKVAKELGATYTIQVAGGDSTTIARQICTTMGCQPDIAIECTGAASSTAAAIHVRHCDSALIIVV